MRNFNIFRTKRDHYIPRDIMIQAVKLSPNEDWTDPNTQAYQFLKAWALGEDARIDGTPNVQPEQNVEKKFDGTVPDYVMEKAKKLGNPDDKRTKAYYYLMGWKDGKND